MPPEQLRAMSVDEFGWHLSGLSQHSRFLRAWHDQPKNLHDPDEIAALTAAARR